ncbi:MAG: uracil-DNA glycosylase [Firmicutes bacterium]|nr:uracil-DNA glycosylase [Bacillota bacterium]
MLTSDRYAGLRTLDELRAECLACQRCGLAAGRNSVVFGEGNPRARIMLVGEGPGRNEDETGRPFVGQAGQLLDKILESVGFKREEVFIANVVKCRPPGNRLPTPEESLACRPFLDAQIRLIDPWIIICLGALSTQSLIDPKGRITTLRGQWIKKDGFWLTPTYHPAALLRDLSKKRPVWEDFKEIRRRYDAMLNG